MPPVFRKLLGAEAPAGSTNGKGERAPLSSRWTELVAKIRDGDPAGLEELYAVFSRGIRYYICRQLGPDELEDRIHDTFLIAVQAISRGELRDPERLMAFIRTIVRRQVATYIERAVQLRKAETDLQCGLGVSDERCDPERDLLARQKVALMEKVLRRMPRRDREILTRFYLLEQTQQQICAQMNLSENQFRLLKSRAKTRFGERGKRRLRAALQSIFGRNSSRARH